MTRTSPTCPTIQATDTAPPARPRRKRQGRPRHPDVEVNVLDAARRLTAAQGPDAWSMDELASVANVGKATIYRRWSSKEAVIWDAWLSTSFQSRALRRATYGANSRDFSFGSVSGMKMPADRRSFPACSLSVA